MSDMRGGRSILLDACLCPAAPRRASAFGLRRACGHVRQAYGRAVPGRYGRAGGAAVRRRWPAVRGGIYGRRRQGLRVFECPRGFFDDLSAVFVRMPAGADVFCRCQSV